ncbi:hypothetical protein MKK58_15660 [Methylobacterium sp. J-078]|uniref:hypothetical protein n=1 Tax=Methylobacterium sp. J-078 TaxID=2836657 RepID=UPI001FBB85A1|nr:hypothetical protein [Methylobacterium sp. J-078]MCJ2045959.1 hypothetical protein [Methylobacterium sp. J-078]
MASGSGADVRAGVLEKADLDRVASVKASFTATAIDVGQALQRADLSGLDRECIQTIAQDLNQMGQELSGYENLMKIETQLNSFSDESTTRDVVLYALDKALLVLSAQRKRLAQPPDHCANLPVSTGKAQSVLRVIEGTIVTLQAMRARL